MKQLPQDVVAYKRTANFNHENIPPALLRGHTTKAGVWGKIVVLKGRLLYRMLEPEPEEIQLSPELVGIVEPTMRHEVQPLGEVEFFVEFYR